MLAAVRLFFSKLILPLLLFEELRLVSVGENGVMAAAKAAAAVRGRRVSTEISPKDCPEINSATVNDVKGVAVVKGKEPGREPN